MVFLRRKRMWLPLVAVGVWIAVYGWCVFWPQTPFSIMKSTSPSHFSSDPLLVRLAAAVDQGDTSAVEAAVLDGADVNAHGKHGYSLLYWAIARDQVAGFEALIKHGADVTAKCIDPALLADARHNITPIEVALGIKNAGFLESIMRQGCDPDYVLTHSGQNTLLFHAVENHSLSAIRTLIDAGANINRCDVAGYTAIAIASMRCDFEAVWFLLQSSADPTVGSEQRRDVASLLKRYGSRGVRPDQREYFEKVVDELVRRGLLTRQDIVEADKPKTPNPGVTVIEHSPDSEAGQAILQLDQREREADARRSH